MHEGMLSADQAERLRALVGASRGVAAERPAATMSKPVAVAPVPALSPGLSVGPTRAGDRTRAPRLARAIAISSGKGGVGKTNLAVNLAVSLVARGRRVAVLDADLGLANADVLCGITPRATLEDVVAGDRTIDEVMVEAPGGFRLVPGASGVSRLADLGQMQRRSVLEQLMWLERSVDVLLIDTGAGIGANSMAFASAAHTILVTATPEPTAIADAYGAIKTLVARGCREGLGLVVNMVGSDEEATAVHARIDRVSRAFLNARIASYGSVPLDAAVRDAVRRREPFALASPAAPASRAVARLAQRLDGSSPDRIPSDVRTSFLGRLLGRIGRRS
ncbi:MAG: hypothetical protein RI967_1798 [Planctomycetota bacterium]